MRPLLLLPLCAALLGGCNRAHLYKKAGIATVSAFEQQAAPSTAPKPRGLDGTEASGMIATERSGFAPSEDNPGAAAGGGAAPKPTGISLQAR